MEKQAIDELRWLALYCTVRLEKEIDRYSRCIVKRLPAPYQFGVAKGLHRALTIVQVYVETRVKELEKK